MNTFLGSLVVAALSLIAIYYADSYINECYCYNVCNVTAIKSAYVTVWAAFIAFVGSAMLFLYKTFMDN